MNISRMKITSIHPIWIALLIGLLSIDSALAMHQSPTLTARVRPAYAVRLGGVFTLGLSNGSSPLEESAKLGTAVSEKNRIWLGENCDLAALDSVTLVNGFYTPIVRAHPLFTPLLLVSAAKIFEQPNHSESVGGWNSKLIEAMLKPDSGKNILQPGPKAHWMDCRSIEWASHWHGQIFNKMRLAAAQGVVATDLPVNPQFPIWTNKPDPFSARLRAATEFLQRVHAPTDYILCAEAAGFNTLAGHSTLPPAASTELSELSGRVWDDLAPYIDGALARGWVYPIGASKPLPEKFWEIELEAADRYARQDQVFIAQSAYHNDAELEFVVASYLLVAHRQGRFVLQPMPIVHGQRSDAGLSLQVLQKEVAAKSRLFNVKLSYPVQERHLVAAEGGMVWRRAFERGVVYVNSSDNITIRVLMGGAMQRLDGTKVKSVRLSPHTGCILLYPTSRQ